MYVYSSNGWIRTQNFLFLDYYDATYENETELWRFVIKKTSIQSRNIYELLPQCSDNLLKYPFFIWWNEIDVPINFCMRSFYDESSEWSLTSDILETIFSVARALNMLLEAIFFSSKSIRITPWGIKKKSGTENLRIYAGFKNFPGDNGVIFCARIDEVFASPRIYMTAEKKLMLQIENFTSLQRNIDIPRKIYYA